MKVFLALLAIAVLSFSAESTYAQEVRLHVGQPLEDALRALQAQGLRIVFTSSTVTPEMRVRVEPRGATPRQQLDALLAPHGLKAQDGPGGVIQVVRARSKVIDALTHPTFPATGTIEGLVLHAFTRAPLEGVSVQLDGWPSDIRTDATGRFLFRRIDAGTWTLRASTLGFVLVTRAVRVARGTTVSITLNLSPSVPRTHSEYVTVSGSRPYRRDRGVASEAIVEGAQLEQVSRGLVNDPLRAVHAFPRVAAVDDYQSDFVVRGSPFRQAEIVIDGVSTPWLQHAAYGRGASGSLTMLTNQVVDEAVLRAGAYPRRYAERLGPQLELTLREGSRAQFKLHGVVGGTNGTVVAERPLGRTARGSWLVAVRQSYLEWPTERVAATRPVFGFADGVAKVVYDVRPNQQVSFSALAGISSIDREEIVLPTDRGDGTNRTSVFNVAWRSTFRSSLVLNQRAYLVSHDFVSRYETGDDRDRGSNEQIVYRANLERPIAGGLLEAGTQVARSSASAGGFAGSSWLRSGYAHFTWMATPNLTFSPGLRVSDSSLFSRRTLTRWMLGEWAFRSGWALNASAGVSHQLPDVLQVLHGGSSELRPERATHVDIGVEHRVTNSMRWQATVFRRDERDILRQPDVYPRLVDGVITSPDGQLANALRGSARGIELLLDRRSPTGLSGWAAYSYGRSRYTDGDRRERFWSDFDQRHGFNLSGLYRFANGASVGTTFRAGSNFPIPAYVMARDGGFFVSEHRNQVRLPAYARLDVRADRELEYFGRRLTPFVEVLNVLNRRNAGLAGGSVNPSTGEVSGLTDKLFGTRLSLGVLISF